MIFAYLLYTFSGLIKTVLLHFSIILPVDFTVIAAFILIFTIGVNISLHGIKFKSAKRFWLSTIILFIFFFWIVFSLIYTPSPDYSKVKTFYFLTNIIAFVYPIVIRNFNYIKYIRWFSVILVVFSIFFILNYDSIKYLSAVNETGADGMYLVLSTLLGVSSLILLTSKIEIFRTKPIDSIVAVVSFLFIIMLGARGPLIFMVFVYLLFILSNFLKKRKHTIKKKYLLIISISLFFAFLIGISAYFQFKEKIDPMLERSYKRFEILIKNDNSQNQNKSVVTRIEQLDFSFNKIFENIESITVGQGIGSFNLLYKQEDGRGYPHNIFIEVWFELGLIGLFIFMAFLAIIVFRKQPNKVINRFILLYIFLNMAKSNSLIDIRVYFAFFALFLLYNHKLKETNE